MPDQTAHDIASGIIRRSGLFLLRMAAIIVWPFALFLLPPSQRPASATSLDASALCDNAAVMASKRYGVPLNVLRAITRTETGRSAASGLAPWPWTVNMQGTGSWFQTEDEARAFVFRHFKRGARSFDVGCFQINFKWHGAAFKSIDDMFDPQANADYAASFLMELYREQGNWTDAAGAYHSRTPELADRYATRFKQIRSGLAQQQNATPTDSHNSPPRRTAKASLLSGQPLPLIGRGSTQLGSLVPVSGRSPNLSGVLIALK